MPLNKVSTQVSFPAIENKISEFWKANNIFEKSVETRPLDKQYTFTDGPPFVSGNPHYASLLPSIAKDIVPRFWTMQGYRVRRVFGWDCHGLPIEEKINSKFNLQTKQEIEAFGIDNYIAKCRSFVEDCTNDWKWYIDRIGRWVDIDNAYYTMHPEFSQSVIWAFKQIYEKGFIYKGLRVSMFSTDNGTPVSEFEVNMDPSNYKEVEDSSIFVKFPLKKEFKTYENVNILAWTTTPWTIPAHAALAINTDMEYSLVEFENQKYIAANQLLSSVFATNEENIGLDNSKLVQILSSFTGKELLGLEYEPPFNFYPDLVNQNNFKIYAGDFVTAVDGTGIVHIAGTYGKEDYDLCKQNNVFMLESINKEGAMIVGSFAGLYLREAAQPITEELGKMDKLFRSYGYTHRLPFYRGDNPLIYLAQEGYFIDIQKVKTRMLELNQDINWFPTHFKEGRFKDVLQNSPDWCISRDRYWATIMPLWVSDDGEELIIGSFEELGQYNSEINFKEENGQKVCYFKDQPLTLHRDICDKIVLTKNGKDYKRVSEVLDCWMDSGSVPFAQYGYPFANKAEFENATQADFIVEYTGQLRAWFNILLRVSTLIFDDLPFKNAVVTGVLAGNDGRKMSKSFGNFPDPKSVLENVGGEALRLYMMGSPIMQGEDMAWSDELLNDQVKTILIPLWNTYSYLCLYSNIHNWTPTHTNYTSEQVLDKWIQTYMDKTTQNYFNCLSSYNIPDSVKLIRPCIDAISTWWIRRSRDRFASGDTQALQTLYAVMVQFTKTFAPQLPFIAEEMYQNLMVLPKVKGYLESVHLELYPEIGEINELLLEEMELTKQICSLGLSIRTESGVNLRQPLTKAITNLNNSELRELIKQELNVKEIIFAEFCNHDYPTKSLTNGEHFVALDVEINAELKAEGTVNDLTRKIQNLRKNKGFKMGEIVNIDYYTSDTDLQNLISQKQDAIKSIVCCNSLNLVEKLEGDEIKVNGKVLSLKLTKVEK